MATPPHGCRMSSSWPPPKNAGLVVVLVRVFMMILATTTGWRLVPQRPSTLFGGPRRATVARPEEDIARASPGSSVQITPRTTVETCRATFGAALSNSGTTVAVPRGVAEGLVAQKIATPTPIQAATLGPLASGRSGLVCAETGSGKSLAFLLPALGRCVDDPDAWVAVLAPTRELAVQLTTEASRVCDGYFFGGSEGEDAGGGAVLLASGSATTLGALRKARCVVATPKAFVEAFVGRPALARKAETVRTLVFDEIDALFPLPSASKDFRSIQSKTRARVKAKAANAKVLTNAERKKKQLEAARRLDRYPALAALAFLLKAAPARDLQIVGCSATASRATRDALKLALHDDPYGRFRADLGGTDLSLFRAMKPKNDASPTSSRGREVVNDEDDDEKAEASSQARPRSVTVPSVVTHVYSSKLEKKAPQSVAARVVADTLRRARPRSALVFLTETSGYAVVKTTAALRTLLDDDDEKWDVGALHDRLFSKEATASAVEDRVSTLEAARADLAEAYAGARTKDEKAAKKDAVPVLVTFEATARGLHFDAVDLVLVVGLPKTAASYLHLAGRAGRRLGDSHVPGTVLTLCPPKQIAVLRSWSKQLGDVTFQPFDDVVAADDGDDGAEDDETTSETDASSIPSPHVAA